MNRRQFLGASLAGIIAALCLPFERFAEWLKTWLAPARRRELFEGVDRLKVLVDPHMPRGQAWFLNTRAFPPGVFWMHPLDFAALEAELA